MVPTVFKTDYYIVDKNRNKILFRQNDRDINIWVKIDKPIEIKE